MTPVSGELAVEGARLAYDVQGPADAPWLTLLHSLATERSLWAPQVAALTRSHRLLRLDLRGHGQSWAGSHPPLMPDLVDDVVAVWNALGVERSSVVGLSIGGMTALGLGLDHADRVARIVAADCRADAPAFFRDMWAQRQALVEHGGLAAILEVTLASWLTAESLAERPDSTTRVSAMILGTSASGYLSATHALSKLDYKRRLPGMTRPVLFLCGDNDGPHPAEMREMAALTPGARFQPIPKASHLSNLEQPGVFNQATLDWLMADR